MLPNEILIVRNKYSLWDNNLELTLWSSQRFDKRRKVVIRGIEFQDILPKFKIIS